MARPLSVRGVVAKLLLPRVSRHQLCRLLVWAAYTALKFAQVLIVGPSLFHLSPLMSVLQQIPVWPFCTFMLCVDIQ